MTDEKKNLVYAKYGEIIPKEVIDKNIDEDAKIAFLNLDAYLVEQLRKGDKNVKEYIKVSNYDIRYKLINKILEEDELDSLYNKAVDLLKSRYDRKKGLVSNIISNAKYIRRKNLSSSDIGKILCGIYDLSSIGEYANDIGLSPNLRIQLGLDDDDFSDLMSGILLAREIQLNVFTKFFRVNDYEELKEKINGYLTKKTQPKTQKVSKTYYIGFMRQYIRLFNINRVEFANTLNISLPTIDSVLEGEKPINQNSLNILLKKYKVEDYNQLKNKILRRIKRKLEEKQIEKSNVEKRDLGFFKEYILLYEIPYADIASLINCGFSVLDEILDSEKLVEDSKLTKLYEKFNVNNFDEFKKLIEEKIKTFNSGDKDGVSQKKDDIKSLYMKSEDKK